MSRCKAIKVLVWSVVIVVGEVLGEKATQLVTILGAVEVDTEVLPIDWTLFRRVLEAISK
jgi:hypothetical protein